MHVPVHMHTGYVYVCENVDRANADINVWYVCAVWLMIPAALRCPGKIPDWHNSVPVMGSGCPAAPLSMCPGQNPDWHYSVCAQGRTLIGTT